MKNFHLQTYLTTFFMATLSYSKQIDQAQVMVSGLQLYAADVAKRGIDAAFTTKLEAAAAKAVELNNQQEKLKADLKTKTTELDALLLELEQMVAESKKVVKISVPQSNWTAFGMNSSR